MKEGSLNDLQATNRSPKTKIAVTAIATFVLRSEARILLISFGVSDEVATVRSDKSSAAIAPVTGAEAVLDPLPFVGTT